jgi:hypothetical protein
MENSIFIARLLAVVYISVALGMLLSPGYYKKVFTEMMKGGSLAFFGGIMAIVVGFLLVTFHNEWETSWVVLITIIGWGALLKGIFLLAVPEQFLGLFKGWYKTNKSFTIEGVGLLIFALVLGYYGFVAVV